MGSDNWVGFAKSPKADPNLSRLRVETGFKFSAAPEHVFQLVTGAPGLSSWLQKTERVEVRTSGKIKFADVLEDFEKGVFSLVQIGRRVVINSELFGEIEIGIEKRHSQISVSFTKMVGADVREADNRKFLDCIERLRAQAGALK